MLRRLAKRIYIPLPDPITRRALIGTWHSPAPLRGNMKGKFSMAAVLWTDIMLRKQRTSISEAEMQHIVQLMQGYVALRRIAPGYTDLQWNCGCGDGDQVFL